jgi:hypothetical protein
MASRSMASGIPRPVRMLVANPCRQELQLERFLPPSEQGPVLRLAFERFASSFCSEIMTSL